MTTVHVKAAYDPNAKVWYVEKSSLPGVFAEGETADELASKLPNIVEDLTGTRSPVEFEAHRLVSRARASGAPFVRGLKKAAGSSIGAAKVITTQGLGRRSRFPSKSSGDTPRMAASRMAS
jgi:hypothetical protein